MSWFSLSEPRRFVCLLSMPTLRTSAYADSLKFAVAATDGDTLARLFDLGDEHAKNLFNSLTNENYVRPRSLNGPPSGTGRADPIGLSQEITFRGRLTAPWCDMAASHLSAIIYLRDMCVGHPRNLS
jgi:hypothetical protein